MKLERFIETEIRPSIFPAALRAAGKMVSFHIGGVEKITVVALVLR
jgi:hypothetical protein